MGTIRFELRTDKPNKKMQCTIRLIYQLPVKGINQDASKNHYVRKYFKTSIKLHPINWQKTTQEAVYLNKEEVRKASLPPIDSRIILTAKEAEQINNSLSALRQEVANIETRFALDKVQYSAEMVIDKLNESKKPLTKKEAPSNEVFGFIEKYIQDNTATRVKGSLSVYRSLNVHLQNYQEDRGKKITFDAINFSFFQDFQKFLLSVTIKLKDGTAPPRLNNTTIAKQLSTLKTFLNYAKVQGVIISDNYKNFKIKKDTLEVIALTNKEFLTLFNFDLSGNKRLAQVRDVFCFSSATAFRYSDLAQLKRDHIKGDEIRLTITKTKEKIFVPLNIYSRAILAKYSDQLKPLPVISNQRMNKNIKELCKLAEINELIEIVRFRGVKREEITYPKYELISCHTGRKTFCSLSLEKGASAEEVMKISGHKDYKSFTRYVNITEDRTREVMRKAWDEIEPNKTS